MIESDGNFFTAGFINADPSKLLILCIIVIKSAKQVLSTFQKFFDKLITSLE